MGARQSSPTPQVEQIRSRSASSPGQRYRNSENRQSRLSADVALESDAVSMRSHHRQRRTNHRDPHPPASLPLPSAFPQSFDIGVKCPSCSRRIMVDAIEEHLMECLAKPRVSYNEDTVVLDAGECIICFEDMEAGNAIARLPCLCKFHKKCIDKWFDVHRCCPSHPDL